MGERTLQELAEVDEDGQVLFGVAVAEDGELVLCPPDGPLRDGRRALDAAERTRLAERGGGLSALVVEGRGGDYVLVVDDRPDLDRYVPLGPADAELLVHGDARARFGRRDDDVVPLLPWADADEVAVVDLDAPSFADVPVVERAADGSLTWHRGGVDDELIVFVQRELERLEAEPGTRVGVLTNLFGECRGVLDGEALLPHEDVRNQTLIATDAVLDDAASLLEAAVRLRSIADRLAFAETQGWRLLQPVTEGIALVERDRGTDQAD